MNNLNTEKSFVYNSKTGKLVKYSDIAVTFDKRDTKRFCNKKSKMKFNRVMGESGEIWALYEPNVLICMRIKNSTALIYHRKYSVR